jgi:hypothetical protein
MPTDIRRVLLAGLGPCLALCVFRTGGHVGWEVLRCEQEYRGEEDYAIYESRLRVIHSNGSRAVVDEHSQACLPSLRRHDPEKEMFR